MTTEEQQVAVFCKLVLENLNGNIKSGWFFQDVGLCSNYLAWAQETDRISWSLKNIVGWDCDYPFGDYYTNGESDNDTIYKNRKRLAFIEKWASKV
jgi:hypothetical protein